MAVEKTGDVKAPDDPYKLVYIIVYWLGIGTLMPWNFFLAGRIAADIVKNK